MARKKVKMECRLQSWADVDNTMRQIAECERIHSDLQNNMNAEKDAATKRYADLAAPVKVRIEQYGLEICQFVTEHRDDLEGKTKELNFGQTGFRVSSKLRFNRGRSEADVVDACEQLGLTDCIAVTKKIVRTTLRQKAANILDKVGAYLKSDDEFWFEIKKDEILPAEVESK